MNQKECSYVLMYIYGHVDNRYSHFSRICCKLRNILLCHSQKWQVYKAMTVYCKSVFMQLICYSFVSVGTTCKSHGWRIVYLLPIQVFIRCLFVLVFDTPTSAMFHNDIASKL